MLLQMDAHIPPDRGIELNRTTIWGPSAKILGGIYFRRFTITSSTRFLSCKGVYVSKFDP